LGKSSPITITVTPATKNTTLTLTASKTSAPVPATITFTATLVDSDGKPVVGRNVDFYVGTAVAWTGTTDSTGKTSVDLGFGKVGTYSVYASFAGDSSYNSSTSSTISISITKAPTSLTLAASRSTIIAGESVDLIATLINSAYNIPVVGATVKFYTSGGALVDSRTTDSSGTAKTTLTIGAAGTYSYYASFDGDANLEGC
jgi:plastocyanin